MKMQKEKSGGGGGGGGEGRLGGGEPRIINVIEKNAPKSRG